MQRLDRLDALVGRLEGLLCSLDGGGEKAAVAWTRCERAFEELRAELEGSPEPLDERERARMLDALRLQAVAASTIGRLQDDLTRELRQVRSSMERLRDARHTESEPTSCDVRG